MNNPNTSAAVKADLSEEALKKIRHAYHALEAFQQTPTHAQAKAKLQKCLTRPRQKTSHTK